MKKIFLTSCALGLLMTPLSASQQNTGNPQKSVKELLDAKENIKKTVGEIVADVENQRKWREGAIGRLQELMGRLDKLLEGTAQEGEDVAKLIENIDLVKENIKKSTEEEKMLEKELDNQSQRLIAAIEGFRKTATWKGALAPMTGERK